MYSACVPQERCLAAWALCGSYVSVSDWHREDPSKNNIISYYIVEFVEHSTGIANACILIFPVP